MLKDAMQKALNEQINAELHSAYLYLSVSAYFESTNLRGFANWMRVQAQEEVDHAMRFYSYVNDRGGVVTLTAIDGPETKWASPLAAFEGALAHERYISGRINDLVGLARKESDYATEEFLQWFVAEQVEEEATADEIVQQLKLIGENPAGLFIMDREMAGRQPGADAAA
ncbi:MAG: ferritin [Anaerolineae bacterium]|nr:ferritin [Anaerolineae bacterium]